METLTFTDTHVMVPSNKPYEQMIRALESVLGGGNVRNFTEMVGVTGTWDEFVRETEQHIGKSGFVIFAQIDHGAWISRVPHDMKGMGQEKRIYLKSKTPRFAGLLGACSAGLEPATF
jgi:hypothetical protein